MLKNLNELIPVVPNCYFLQLYALIKAIRLCSFMVIGENSFLLKVISAIGTSHHDPCFFFS